MIATILLAASSLLLPTTGTADGPTMGVVFDPVSLSRTANLPSFSTTYVYIVAGDLRSATAWEAGLQVDPGFSILGVSFNAWEPPLGGDDQNYYVGLGGCTDFGAGANWLARIVGGYFAGTTAPEMLFCVAPAQPSSLPEDPRPALVDCADNLLAFRPMFGQAWSYPIGCAVANPISIGNAASSWGALKSAAD